MCKCYIPSLVSRPFFDVHEKYHGRPGGFGDVMMTYLPPLLQTVAEFAAEIVADTSSLHHQIDQVFPIFLAYI